MRTALVFPGQGAQSAGMGRGLVNLPAVTETVEQCSAQSALPILGYLLNTPDAELCATERAQPAIFALSVGLARAVLDAGVRPVLFAGHSIGHFAALTVSGALRPDDAARLIAERGRLMAAAGARRPGGMGVVLGLDSRTVVDTLDTSGLPLWPAVINLPRQITVSGDRNALEEGRRLFTGIGGRWRTLNVSGAFHSPLLEDEAEQFAILAETLEIAVPSAPILRNRDGAMLIQPECIREDLKRHMTGPVRWVAVMERLFDAGLGLVIETGPGRVLTGLIRRHARGLPIVSTETPCALHRAVQAATATHSKEDGR